MGAFIASGNWVPVDPNGPGGPPTLEPYYNPQIILYSISLLQRVVIHVAKKIFSYKHSMSITVEKTLLSFYVIDTSGSMSYANKMGNTKNALKYFTSNMGGLSAIGIDTFSKDDTQEASVYLL